MTGLLRKGIVWGVLTPFSAVTLAIPAAQATAVVSTTQAMAQAGLVDATPERARVSVFMARKDVTDQLLRLGVDPVAAQARVASLTDAEIARIDQHLDQLPAGGDGVIGALVFIFVLLLITDILGFTKVFPFTRSARR